MVNKKGYKKGEHMNFKFKLHSSVDVITNSSTTIFTYYGFGVVRQAKTLLQEMLKHMGNDENVDDVFDISTYARNHFYLDYITDCDDEYFVGTPYDGMKDDVKLALGKDFYDLDYSLKSKRIHAFINGVKECNISKPKWMNHIEDTEWYGEGYTCVGDTDIHVISKDDKYKDIARSIELMLKSVDAEDVSY